MEKYDQENPDKETPSTMIIESKEQVKSQKLHIVQLSLACFYFVFIISFALACIIFPEVKSQILLIFMMMQLGSIKVYVILILFSTLLYIFCFPVAIFEIFLGNIIHPYWLAVVIAVTIKLLSNASMFYISRFLLKEEITNFFAGNKIFETVQIAIKQNPLKIIFMLKLMMIPHMLKNYGLGVMDVTFLQFFIPALITGSLYTAFWVNMGSKLYSVFNSKEIAKNNEIKNFEIGIVILSIVLFIFLAYLGKKQYEQVQKELVNDEYQQVGNEGNRITYGTIKKGDDNQE